MNSLDMYFDTMSRIYHKPALGLLIFGLIFVTLGRRPLFKPLSKGTTEESMHNLLLLYFNVFAAALIFGNLSFLSNLLFETLSLPHISGDFWAGQSIIVTFFIALLALDFQNYWAHRLLHTKYLWGVHALHHSDAHMTWTTTYRIHIFEWAIMSCVYVSLIGWLKLPVEAVAAAGAIRSWHSKLIHCQLGWTFGRFSKVLASPNYHRWHHSVEPESFGKNLSDMFPMWDILFGTHYNPGVCETELGVADMKDGFFPGQLYPFKYAYEGLKRRLPRRKITQSRIP